MKNTPQRRKKGSCRFATYYKLEYFDETLSVWRPLQKSFPTFADATAAMTTELKWRLFKVSETERSIVA